jgi:N-hydroxyarylamine O-acetyltransferase
MTTDTPDTNRFDLSAYLGRIGYAGDLRPSLALLESLHLAHATHIPFENLDILLHRPIRLDLQSLQAKMVGGLRGGYCFEQNLLFAAALESVGFPVRRLAARVRYRTQAVLPRTHMLLLVDVDGSGWIADVGFGAKGLLLPVPFRAGEPVRQFAWTYRIVDDAGQWVLQSLRHEKWSDLYAFTLEPHLPVDYELANYYVSTHPNSRFVQTLTAQSSSPEARRTLRNRELIVDRGEAVDSQLLADDDELLEVLADTFGLRFPPGTRFAFREPAGAPG